MLTLRPERVLARIGMLHLALAAVVVCASSSAAREPDTVPSDGSKRSDFISFIAVSPPTDSMLERGQQFALEASVEYELVSRRTAFIKVTVEDEKRATLSEFKSAKVGKGRSTYRCAGTVEVPKKGRRLHLVAQLYEPVPRKPPNFASSSEEILQEMTDVPKPRTIALAEVRFEIR